jgi:drug/metabolite transporter (DMT)-like permease
MRFIIASIFMSFIGIALIVTAYQLTCDKTPEYVYSIFAVGTFIFSSFPFVLVVGLGKVIHKPNILRIFRWLRISTSIACYVTLFDACKEIVSLNNDHSTAQMIFFFTGLLLTILAQYGINKRNADSAK